MQEVRDQLREMAPGRGWSDPELLALIVYNNHINGDWKRQHYYKPSPERMAQIALYEWVQDGSFNSLMSQSASRVDLTGAFSANPIPTLIMEGEWDLTWGPEKRRALAANHPNGRMVTFEEAGHSIFNEDADGFFTALQDFVQGLSPVATEAMAGFQGEMEEWREAWMASPRYQLRVVDWGQAASEAIAEVFTRFHAWGRLGNDDSVMAMAGIWEGHMLDLLGRRGEAMARYQEVVDFHRDDTWSHSQYGLRYSFSAYAEERLKEPFQRIQNRGL